MDIDRVLREGGTLRFVFDPGESGQIGEGGQLRQEPTEPHFRAELRDLSDRMTAGSIGGTPEQALQRLRESPSPPFVSNRPPF